MSVVGFDLGYQSCFVAVARKGGIEVVANEHSDRATPSFVSFSATQRFVGVPAKQQLVTNRKNTVYGVKKLLGRQHTDPRVGKECELLPYKVVQTPNGLAGIEVSYGGETQVFRPEQITAMLLTKLKETAAQALGIKITDCVIGVPSFYTDTERNFMLHAAQAAGLNCLRVMNETTAVALDYGIYKSDLPPPEEKARNVVFVDMGQAHTQVSVAAFNKGQLKMLASTFDADLGGRDFTRVIVNHFVEDFRSRLRLDATTNERALLRLVAECEKLKKLMSANSTDIPINLECFMNDRDVSGRYSRGQLEEASADLLNRFKTLLGSILDLANLKPADLYSVEIVGGSTRIPAVKQLIRDCLGLEPMTTLNADEAVSRGCALQCAMLSPTFVVREFKVTDCLLFPIRLDWDAASESEDASLELMTRYQAVPQSKMLTFYRTKPFSVRASYSDPRGLPMPDPYIGTFYINDVTPKSDGKPVKVKVKGRVNQDGLFMITEATTTEKIEVPVEPMEVDGPAEKTPAPADSTAKEGEQAMESEASEGQAEGSASATSETEAPAPAPAAEASEGKKKAPSAPKVKVRSIELGVTMEVNRLPTKDVEAIQELELKMVANDRLEQERQNAKNSVEEYVYEMRGKLCESLEAFINEQAKETFNALLTSTEDWLYDEGEDLHKQAYVDRLAQMKALGDPVVKRALEHQLRPAHMESLARSLTHVTKVLQLYADGDEKYSHLDADDMKKVAKQVEEKRQYYDSLANQVSRLIPTENPPVLCQQMRAEQDLFEKFCNPIINKAKPKPPKVEPPKDEPAGDAAANKNGTATVNGEAPGTKNQSANNSSDTSAPSTEQPAAAACGGGGGDGEGPAPSSTDHMDLD